METDVPVVSACAAFPAAGTLVKQLLGRGLDLVVTGLVEAMGAGADVFGPINDHLASDGAVLSRRGILFAEFQVEGTVAKVVCRVKPVVLPLLFYSAAFDGSFLVEVVFLPQGRTISNLGDTRKCRFLTSESKKAGTSAVVRVAMFALALFLWARVSGT